MEGRFKIYEEVSARKGIGVNIDPSLCFYNPEEVYNALVSDGAVLKWLAFIAKEYSPPRNKRTLLIFPCSTNKPYHKSRSYRMLFKTLSRLGDNRKIVHLVTISEPFGIVPEELYGETTQWHDWKNDWYDCPGLFRWWCDKYNQPYSEEFLDKSIDCLSSYVAEFFKNAESKGCYSKFVAFVRTYSSKLEQKKDHTHRRIIENASEIAGIDVEILPTRNIVSSIVRQRGQLAWDMYGVAHPLAQEYLLGYLQGL